MRAGIPGVLEPSGQCASRDAGSNVILCAAGSGLPTEFQGSEFPAEASFQHLDPVWAVLSSKNWEFLSYLLFFWTHPVLYPLSSATLKEILLMKRPP